MQFASSSLSVGTRACAHSWKNRKSRTSGGSGRKRSTFQVIRHPVPVRSASATRFCGLNGSVGCASISVTTAPAAMQRVAVPSANVNAAAGAAQRPSASAAAGRKWTIIGESHAHGPGARALVTIVGA